MKQRLRLKRGITMGKKKDKKKNKQKQDEECYVITPKGIAVLAMIKAGIYANITDEQFEMFWEDFDTSMEECGYIREE